MRRSPFVWLPLSCVALVGCVSTAMVGGSSNGQDGGDAAIEDDAPPAPDAAVPDGKVLPDATAECGAPTPETCNGLDDDCNGRVDDITPGACSPAPCATGHLACVAGAERCVTDALLPTTAVCRPSAGVCDVAESCTGTSEACPADVFLPRGTRAYERSPSTLPFIDACGAPGAQRILRGTDDGVLPLTLPFSFPFYGVPRGDASVSSNGLLTFGPPALDAGYHVNATLPDAHFPAAVFAYFDDVMTRSTGICVATVGAAPDRRFVVQWADAHYCCTDEPGTHLSFEVVLSEAGGAVDVRYDRMESAAEPGRASGDNATVGIQDGLGRLHDLVGFNRAGAVASGAGFRWTPTTGAVCRPSVGTCDLPEYCDGATAACPADARLPVGSSCGAGLVCGAGAECCVGGPTGCAACPRPVAEVCNNLDDDCDGTVDDGLTRVCYVGPAGTAGVGICRGGTQSCAAGAWSGACVGQVLPATEVCDGLDNNCDGAVDESCGCPRGQTMCAGTCRDLSNDASHCGACGTVCSTAGASSTSCVSGTCRPACATGASGVATFNAGGVGPTGTLQSWTVPAGVTSVTVEAWGAQGGGGAIYGTSAGAGGRGAYVRGTFTVTPGSVIDVLVGQAGGSSGGPHGNENGGGGGSFVVARAGNMPLAIAGGGGGAPASSYGLSCARTPAIADGQAGNSGASSGCFTVAAGGVGGGGGATAGSYQGGAGGGFTGNGAGGGTHCSTAAGGMSYLNGGAGGAGNTCYNTNNFGGYGGGGGGQLGGPGGGGGYSGGSSSASWSSHSNYGGGGGSYNAGSAQTNTAGVQAGGGRVVITYASPSFGDCDGAGANGCEAVIGGACYGGPAGTAGVGACRTGTTTCTPGACVGQVLPTPEICDGVDNNCDGAVDEPFRTANPFPSTGADGAFAPTGDTVLAARTYHFTTVRIPAGVTVTTSGSGVLELRASGDVTVAGAIDVSGGRGGDSGSGTTSCRTGGGSGGATAGAAGAAGNGTCGAAGPGGQGAAGGAGGMVSVCSAPGGNFGGGAGGGLCNGGAGGGGYAGGSGGGGWGVGGGAGGSAGGSSGGAAVGSQAAGLGGVSPGVYAGGVGRDERAQPYVGGGGGGGAIGAAAAADLAVATTFYPGSGGGGGGGQCNSCAANGGGGGGGGGGALRVATSGTLTVTGALRANGGAGGAEVASTGSGGGGGGSGGVIHLLAVTSLNVSGAVTATGGAGGVSASGAGNDGGGAGGLGRIKVSAPTGACALGGSFNPPLQSGCTPSGAVAGRAYVEGVSAGGGRACYTGPAGTAGVGACRAGVDACGAGVCVGQVLPSSETCDNVDNNCNGGVDESLTRACYLGPAGTAGVGICRNGTQTCAAGAWGATCTGLVLPRAETCNGLDDDCDGTVDDGVCP